MASPSLHRRTVPEEDGIVVRSPAMQHLMQMVERIADSPATVLIHGETGTGKEVIARALHYRSRRCHKRFVEVNCAALPAHLVESELFGHEKGAFSGAHDSKPGFYELADGGTLFLDEIGELDLQLQSKLLRVLDGSSFYRLGGTQKITVNVRTVAASNRDLRSAVSSLKFRSDLYYRLSQLQLKLPPLRERPEDVEAIAEQSLERTRPGTNFSPDAMRALLAYHWPGNIRELQSVVLNLVLTLNHGADLVTVSNLPTEFQVNSHAADPEEVYVGNLDDMEKLMIERTLEESGGDHSLAAGKLGISRRTLSRKIKAFGLGKQNSMEEALGSLNEEQVRYFRALLQRPVRVRSSRGYQVLAESSDLSLSGIGVRGLEMPLKFTGTVDLEFDLGSAGSQILAKGKIIWTDSLGCAGIRFVSMSQACQDLIRGWIADKRLKEGWDRQV